MAGARDVLHAREAGRGADHTTWDMLRASLLLGVLVHGVGTMRRLVRTEAWLGVGPASPNSNWCGPRRG